MNRTTAAAAAGPTIRGARGRLSRGDSSGTAAAAVGLDGSDDDNAAAGGKPHGSTTTTTTAAACRGELGAHGDAREAGPAAATTGAGGEGDLQGVASSSSSLAYTRLDKA